MGVTIGGDWPRMYVPASVQGGDGSGRVDEVALHEGDIRDVPAGEQRQNAGAYLDGNEEGWIEGKAIALFEQGYRDARGPEHLLVHVVYHVIACEYGGGDVDWAWRPYDAANPNYRSRAQFHPDTWARAGGGDPADDYQVGGNVARWINAIAEPGSTSGWPHCWW